jgi:uncharacterized repeat protein (TIGR02543 family)
VYRIHYFNDNITELNLNYMKYILLGFCSLLFLLPQYHVDAAYPDVVSVTESVFTTDATDHQISMPENVTAGDLLLIIFTNDGSATVTKPVEWRTLWNESTGSALRAGGYAKVAVGNEGSTTVNFVTSSAEQAVAQVYKIQNWYGTLDGIAVGSGVISTEASPGGTTANPPSLTPSWGEADTLWIPIVHTSTGRTIVSGSSGYSSLIMTRSSETTASGQIGSMRLNANTATEDPGIFTFSSTGVTSVSQTVAIAPSGVNPTKFFQNFNVTQPGTSTELFVPLYTSQPYLNPDNDIKRAVIVIHGSNNNAIDYFDYAANAVSNTDGIIVLAPQFAESNNNPEVNQLFWSSGWRQCNRSDTSLPWRIASCEVIDQLITSLYSTFPNLDSIVIAGFSAGGQFVNRYASAKNDNRNRYIVGAPSSYLYFSNVRPDGSGNFTVPVTACTTYNDYKFGLDNLSITNYMDVIGASELTSRYGQANITYLIGSNDNDPLDSSLDKDCEAEIQGAYRLSRMQNFYDYLELEFGSDIYNRHKMEIVDGYAHESQYIFGSPQGRNAFLEGYDFSLSFDVQGGSSVSSVSVASGATTTLPVAPTRSGYSFQNWNTVSGGSGTAYLAETSYTMPSNNTTLYAIWSVVPSDEVVTDGEESGGSGGKGKSGSKSGGGSKSKHQSNASSTTLHSVDSTSTSTLAEIIFKYKEQLLYAHSLGIKLPQIIIDLLNLPVNHYSISKTYLSRNLTLGMSGDDVLMLQNFLIGKGYSISAGATGYFGNQTQSSLASYQLKNNIIPASGYLGLITRDFINNAITSGV